MKEFAKVKRLGKPRKGQDKPGDAFAVQVQSFDENGHKKEMVIVNIFIGPDRSEAVRFAEELNNAWWRFHNG